MAKHEPSARLRTSREVYDRIRWDPHFDPASFVIGYEARLPAPKEVPFTGFVPDGDIPWHRVLYFREGDAIVWDRRSKVDKIFGSGATARTARAASAALLPSEVFAPLVLHGFDPDRGTWTDALPQGTTLAAPPAPARSLRVATWNVLSDQHVRERVQTARRAPAIVAALEQLEADVLALQEVSPAVHAALLAAPWVRARYTVSEGPDSPALRTQGTLFLFRAPAQVVQLGVHAFSHAKRAVAAVLRWGAVSVVVAQVHLPSDHAADAARNREAYLTELLNGLGAAGVDAPPVVLLGDFNWDAAALDALAARYEFGDAWAALHAAPVATFDPARNALAKVMSRTGKSVRIDRVFTRDGSRALRATAATLFGTEALAPGPEPLFASDHFGVCVTLEVRAAGGAVAAGNDAAPSHVVPHGHDEASAPWGAPTHHTAVVLVPPSDVWGPIQSIRGTHDRHATRWMPHITLLYPFVPEADLARAREHVAAALADLAHFDVTLAGLETFEHGHRDTVWARPEAHPPGALHALYAALVREFPQDPGRRGHSDAGFTPHLTLAQVDRGAAQLAQWRRDWRPLRFTVDAVQIIVRHGETPFEARYTVPVGHARDVHGDDPLQHWLTAATPAVDPAMAAARARVVALLGDACAYAAGDTATVALHLTGATRLNLATTAGDVDAVAVGPAVLARAAFFTAAQEWLRGAGAEARVVTDTVAPVLRGTLDGAAFDLGYAALPAESAGLDPCALTSDAVARMEAPDALALGAVRDADALERALAGRVEPAAFADLVRAVKHWARARGVYSNGFGYLSGFGWTLLAAWACVQRGAPQAPSALLAHAFRAWAAWPAARALALTAAAEAYVPRSRDALVLPTPSAPSRNVARNVFASTAAVLRGEVARAAELSARAAAGEVAWDAVFAPYDAAREGTPVLVMDVRAESTASFARASGWLEGVVVGKLRRLEGDGVSGLRPDPRPQRESALHGRYVVVAGATEQAKPAIAAAASALERAFATWDARPDDARFSATPVRGA